MHQLFWPIFHYNPTLGLEIFTRISTLCFFFEELSSIIGNLVENRAFKHARKPKIPINRPGRLFNF